MQGGLEDESIGRRQDLQRQRRDMAAGRPAGFGGAARHARGGGIGRAGDLLVGCWSWQMLGARNLQRRHNHGEVAGGGGVVDSIEMGKGGRRGRLLMDPRRG